MRLDAAWGTNYLLMLLIQERLLGSPSSEPSSHLPGPDSSRKKSHVKEEVGHRVVFTWTGSMSNQSMGTVQ